MQKILKIRIFRAKDNKEPLQKLLQRNSLEAYCLKQTLPIHSDVDGIFKSLLIYNGFIK